MTLDARTAELAYMRMAEQAIRWEENEIAIECVRSRVVMLDEYLGRHEEAIAVLDEADSLFGRHERLVRSRAAVLSSMGRHADELELLSELVPEYSEDEPLERLLMLRTAAISAGKLGHFRRSAELFHQAYDLARTEPPTVLATNVRPGLLADAAVMEMREGRPAKAITDLMRALDAIEEEEDIKSLPSFARSIITLVIQWAAADLAGQSFPQDPSTSPGVCSTLQPDFDPAQVEPLLPNQELYLLARLEGIAGVDVGAERLLLERERNDGIQLKLAVGLAASQMERNIRTCDTESLFLQLPRFAALSGLLFRAGGADASHPAEAIIAPEQWEEVEQLAARTAVSGLIGMLFVNRREADAKLVAEKVRKVSPSLSGLIPEVGGDRSGDAEFCRTGVAALRLLQSDANLNAEQLLRASVKVFTWLRHVGVSALNEEAHSMLQSRWLQLARERPALLSNPRLAVPAIEEAATVPPGIGGIARLVEAGTLGTSLGLPSDLIEVLRLTR